MRHHEFPAFQGGEFDNRVRPAGRIVRKRARPQNLGLSGYQPQTAFGGTALMTNRYFFKLGLLFHSLDRQDQAVKINTRSCSFRVPNELLTGGSLCFEGHFMFSGDIINIDACFFKAGCLPNE